MSLDFVVGLMESEWAAADRYNTREGARAKRAEDYPEDLLNILLIEHEDVLERSQLIQAYGSVADTFLYDYPRKPALINNDNAPNQYLLRAHQWDLTALCLSGGGIRSAAFALGVLQGLAKHQLLHKFDRLSTVSGGGYIGSWLTTWVQRKGYDTVSKEIQSDRSAGRQSPLVHLSRYSRYLAPRAGLFSTDALSLATLYLRNLLLNWLVLLPVLVLGILAIKVLAVVSWSIPAGWTGMLVALAMMFVGLALFDSLLQRPGWEARGKSVLPFAATELVPMLLGAICATMAALAGYSVQMRPISWSSLTISYATAGSILAALAWLFAFYFASLSPDPKHTASVATDIAKAAKRGALAKHVVMAAIAFICSGAIVGVALATILHLAVTGRPSDYVTLTFITLGPTLVLFALFVGELLYTGLTSYSPWGDAEREWLARSGGRHAFTAATWALSVGTVLFGPLAIFKIQQELPGFGTPSILASGSFAGLVIALLGKTPRTVAIVKDTVHKTLADYSIATILAIAVPVFAIFVASLISWAIDIAGGAKHLVPSSIEPFDSWPWKHFVWITFFSLIVGALFSLVVNINRFSLHGVYRNRLVRTFLGASNFDREPNPETDFDDRDNISLHELWPQTSLLRDTPPQLLYINMSLNILRGRELAWQERKALPFVATARYVGSGNLPWVDCKDVQRIGGFRKAREYARGRKTDPNAKGLSLGTAMALSGAAASPNMGYHSSPALSLLLTMLNVRLGGWFANPGPAGAARIHRSGPTIAVWPLIEEALGLTSEERSYVYLSDGGHFENLGAYEMLRRRCHYIVISDAGCDGDYIFEDLGNLERKASIDLGVQLKFHGLERLRCRIKSQSPNDPIGVVADIIYPELPKHPGKLLYIKPGYHGGEPPSVRSYGELHRDFPHESTRDQFFGEIQFEAYRALGEHSIEKLIGNKSFQADSSIASFIAAVEDNLGS